MANKYRLKRGELHLRARWDRFWHTLRWCLAGHCGITGWDHHGNLVLIACSCGRSFWQKP